jgi:two-component system, OmpR family, response regulator
LYGKRVQVLVVDDEPSICKALCMALTHAGYEAQSAESGAAALEIIRALHIDVMIVDLRIPDMRGDVIFETAAAIQPHLRARSLFLTGDITDNGKKLIAACRCNFLRKPFDLRDVTDAVAALSPRLHDATG